MRLRDTLPGLPHERKKGVFGQDRNPQTLGLGQFTSRLYASNQIGDALTHARVYRDDSQIDELVVKRGEIIKGGRVDVELYEVEDKT